MCRVSSPPPSNRRVITQKRTHTFTTTGTGTGHNATAMAAATGMASAEASEALNLVGHFVRDCVAHGMDTQVWGGGGRVWESVEHDRPHGVSGCPLTPFSLITPHNCPKQHLN